MGTRLRSALDLWAAGVRLGLHCLPRDPVLGLKRLALPVSYWRATEFDYVLRHLRLEHGARVLDLGSPKDLAILLARRRGYEIVSTDILPHEVEMSRRYAVADGRDGVGPGKVHSAVQDGRSLSFEDNWFDGAFSVSVLEHIPHRGDVAAVRELVRVVKPGGIVVITTPYDRRYRETFVHQRVYEREQRESEAVFYERHYDTSTLRERLLETPGTRLVDLQIWGENRIRVERFLDRIGRARALLSPVEALLAAVALKPISPEGQGHPMAAFLTLEKLQL